MPGQRCDSTRALFGTAYQKSAVRISLKRLGALAILRLHVVTPAYFVFGGRTTRVKREQFGGINLLLSLKIEASAETNRP